MKKRQLVHGAIVMSMALVICSCKSSAEKKADAAAEANKIVTEAHTEAEKDLLSAEKKYNKVEHEAVQDVTKARADLQEKEIDVREDVAEAQADLIKKQDDAIRDLKEAQAEADKKLREVATTPTPVVQ